MDIQDAINVLNDHYSLRFEKAEFNRDGGSLSYVVFTDIDKYFLRIIRPALMDTALSSVGIHLYLSENHFPVPRIVFTKAGAPYVTLEKQNGPHLYVLYDFIEGGEPDLNEDAERIGSLVGKFHSVMQDYKGNLAIRDKYFFIDRYIEILRKMKYPDNKINLYKEHGDALWERVKNLPRGYCHGDLYIGNVHKAQTGELYILDFDTSCNAFPANDIIFVCNSTHYFDFDERGYGKTQKIIERFLHGYSPYRTLSEAEKFSLNDLLAVTHYQLQATIIEIYGLDCVDEAFLDKQFDWLMKWQAQCEKEGPQR